MNYVYHNNSMEKKELWKEAFELEALRSVEYQLYANEAKEEGYETLYYFFMKQSRFYYNRSVLFYQLLHNMVFTTTWENLKRANEDAKHDAAFLKTLYEETNKEECLKLCELEYLHREQLNTILEAFLNETIFLHETPVIWECTYCGFQYESTLALKNCCICHKPKAFFQKI